MIESQAGQVEGLFSFPEMPFFHDYGIVCYVEPSFKNNVGGGGINDKFVILVEEMVNSHLFCSTSNIFSFTQTSCRIAFSQYKDNLWHYKNPKDTNA